MARQLKKYTVVGFYRDNEQPWVAHVKAANPHAAVNAGIRGMLKCNDWDDSSHDCISVLEVFACHRMGLLGNDKALTGYKEVSSYAKSRG